ncbi:hypothetical protein [Altererythrobacter lutimaris]|uniref:Uncharacterized protein n=1 Tax=Altererythrobacter lutimaris TaxID=2743979 RepID=A0A850H3M4_9SPHN|nr:hypothetical protein [Altererythrobacter lutimaris]NVE93774.1 hypothetical protein [Altererythrobacter lutimaris]
MKAICTPILVTLSAVSVSVVAQETPVTEVATHPEATEEAPPVVEIIERDETGKATRIRIESREYALCSDTVMDSCISPRAAGFDWGSQPLDHWPGQTATSLKQERASKAQASQELSEEAGDAEEAAPPQGQ